MYEALVARIQRRRPCDAERDIVAFGPVGSRWAGRLRIFRYEIQRWRDGYIPDVAEAVDSPQQLNAEPETARARMASRVLVAHRQIQLKSG